MKVAAYGLVSLAVIGIILLTVFYKPAHVMTPAERAEQRYDFLVDNKGPIDEQCAAAKAVVSAYVDAQDVHNYRTWQQTAYLTCEDASMQQRLRI